MRLYLAGPMTGLPQFNIPAFDAAAARLRAEGHEVISPVELDGPEARAASLASPDGAPDTLATHGFEYEDFLERDTEVLRSSDLDAIVMLPGWARSRGANRELGVAIGLGLQRLYYDPLEPAGYRRTMEREAPRVWSDPDSPRHTAAEVAAASEYTVQPYADLAHIYGQVVADPPGAVKADGGKARMDLLPVKPLRAISEVLAFGANKYPDPIARDYNWRRGFAFSRIYGAALRHLTAWWDGEDLDPETGLPHLSHAGCDILFLLEFVLSGTGDDDRYMSQVQRAAPSAREDQ